MLKSTQKKLKAISANAAKLFFAGWVLYALYLVLLASPQFESKSQLIIKQSDGGSSFDPASLVMASVSDAPLSTDSVLVEAFIKSQDMYNYLDTTIGLTDHYQTDQADFFSRLSDSAPKEKKFEYYLNHIEVTVDSASAVITLETRGFTSKFANTLNKTIIEHAEDFINNINNDLAKSKLDFAKGEHEVVEQKLSKAKRDLLAFQAKYNVLDPTAEGAASQQIAFSMEATLAQKQAELRAMSSTMSDLAPEIRNIRRQISALQEAVSKQKNELNTGAVSSKDNISMTEVMAQYSDLQIQLQLAIQAYSSSLMTLENTRVEAYEKVQHLVTIEKPTLPDSHQYPEIIYDLTLCGVILFMLYGIGRIVIATIREL